MSLFWIVLLILLLVLAIWGMFDSGNRKNSIKNEIAELQNFSPDHAWYSHDWGHAMALDISRRQLALVRRTQDKLHTSIINANQIVSAEILEDGASLVKTARIGQLGGAAVGGLIFGPLGAVVGGLSSGKRQIDKARSIDLDIIVQDLAAPRFTARFLATEVDKSGFVYKAHIGEAREWAARIDALIHNA
jgi:uncharacterized membrane protein